MRGLFYKIFIPVTIMAFIYMVFMVNDGQQWQMIKSGAGEFIVGLIKSGFELLISVLREAFLR